MTLADCEKRLVYTAFERYLRADFVLENLINKPPFTNQSYHDELLAELENEAQRFEQDIKPTLEETRALYNQQLNAHPTDWALRWKRAIFSAQDPSKLGYVATEFKKVLQTLPYHKAYKGLLPILIRQNKLEEAQSYATELLEMRPTSADAYIQLGIISRKRGDRPNAITYFSKAIGLNPESPIRVREYLAEAFVKIG